MNVQSVTVVQPGSELGLAGRARKTLTELGRRVAFRWPWFVLTSALRLLYGFRAEGISNIPDKGPFIVAYTEWSVLSTLICGWISIQVLGQAENRKPGSGMAFLQEELWSMGYFRKALGPDSSSRFRPLVPQAAGQLAVGLMDGYRILRQGGVVVMNPEGDAPWDGRPLPIRHGLPWLALHSGAPVVPSVVTVGSYDIWPRWQRRPNLRGQVRLVIGEPIKLSDGPLTHVTDQDLKDAADHIRAEYDRLRYGAGGPAAWIEPPARHGKPLSEVPALPLVSPATARPQLNGADPRAASRLGVVQLLWRCPICGTDDVLIQTRRRLRCAACDTVWTIRHRPGHDYRLQVIAGPPEALGLDMALCTWYDAMKGSLRPVANGTQAVDPLPGEEVYLALEHSGLDPHRPNALFNGWDGREAPQAQLIAPHEAADWPSLGEGRLLLTSHRLQWSGKERVVDFYWPAVTSLYVWGLNTLGVRYGAAPYRLTLGQEPGLKWLTYAATLAKRAERDPKHALLVQPI